MLSSQLQARRVAGHDPALPLSREVRRLAEELMVPIAGRRQPLHRMIVGAAEKALISYVIEHCRGNQVKAALFLGVNRNTLRARLHKYGIQFTW